MGFGFLGKKGKKKKSMDEIFEIDESVMNLKLDGSRG